MAQEFTEEQLRALCERLLEEGQQQAVAGFTNKDLAGAMELDWDIPYHQDVTRRMASRMRKAGLIEPVKGLVRLNMFELPYKTNGWRVRQRFGENADDGRSD